MKDFPDGHGDARFSRLAQALHEAEPAHGWEPPEEGRIEAAVAVVLRSCPEVEVLLMRRALSERDPWSGQMALPGGRREDGDESLFRTAVRETHEETGLDLAALGTPLGRLEDVRPRSRRIPFISVTPYVFGVSARADARAASSEVDVVTWVRLAHFQDPESHDFHEHDLGSDVLEFPGFRVEEGLVWGLTYRILTRFLEVCPWTADPPVHAPE